MKLMAANDGDQVYQLLQLVTASYTISSNSANIPILCLTLLLIFHSLILLVFLITVYSLFKLNQDICDTICDCNYSSTEQLCFACL
jgi:hypothetical protein